MLGDVTIFRSCQAYLGFVLSGDNNGSAALIASMALDIAPERRVTPL
jgi:hypothetical protein